jgi:hypothetical protein
MHLFIVLLVKLSNQYLQLLVGSTIFFLLKRTTIDLLHVGAINATGGFVALVSYVAAVVRVGLEFENGQEDVEDALDGGGLRP